MIKLIDQIKMNLVTNVTANKSLLLSVSIYQVIKYSENLQYIYSLLDVPTIILT